MGEVRETTTRRETTTDRETNTRRELQTLALQGTLLSNYKDDWIQITTREETKRHFGRNPETKKGTIPEVREATTSSVRRYERDESPNTERVFGKTRISRIAEQVAEREVTSDPSQFGKLGMWWILMRNLTYNKIILFTLIFMTL